MSRVFALLLAFALLFQTSWAVAATYCAHEAPSEAQMHFGHHVHVHKSVDGQKQVAGKLAVDHDCGWCNAGHAAILGVAMQAVAADTALARHFPQPSLHGSALARAPDRPQWGRLA